MGPLHRLQLITAPLFLSRKKSQHARSYQPTTCTSLLFRLGLWLVLSVAAACTHLPPELNYEMKVSSRRTFEISEDNKRKPTYYASQESKYYPSRNTEPVLCIT